MFYSFSGFLTVGSLGVYQDQKGFSLDFQLFYGLGGGSVASIFNDIMSNAIEQYNIVPE